MCLTTTTIVVLVDRGECCSGIAGRERTVAKVTTRGVCDINPLQGNIDELKGTMMALPWIGQAGSGSSSQAQARGACKEWHSAW